MKTKIEEKLWFEKIYDQLDIIEENNDTLKGLMRAFSRIGNFEVARELCDVTISQTNVCKIIREEIAKEINQNFNQSQQSSLNILNATLAGVKLGEKSNAAK